MSAPRMATSPWEVAVGRPLFQSALSESGFVALSRRCIVHAYAVNRPYFASRITPERLIRADAVIGAFDSIAGVEDYPADDIGERELEPPLDSDDEIVPGWGSFVDAVRGFLSYRSARNPDALFHAIGNAYMSVSSRAYAQHLGVEGNTNFSLGEEELERHNELCASEIEFQVGQLEKSNLD